MIVSAFADDKLTNILLYRQHSIIVEIGGILAEDKKVMISPREQDPRFLKGLGQQIKLILRLMSDKRVNPLLKVLPLASLAYLIWPFDFLPFLPIDDAIAIGLGLYTFVEMCPDDVVEEHKQKLAAEGNASDSTKRAS